MRILFSFFVTRHQLMSKRIFRTLHRQVAPFMVLPLLITALTGVTYRLGKDWLGWTRDQAHFLMVIHEGEYLGDDIKPFYVLLNACGVLFLLATGTAMVLDRLQNTPWVRNWRDRLAGIRRDRA